MEAYWGGSLGLTTRFLSWVSWVCVCSDDFRLWVLVWLNEGGAGFSWVVLGPKEDGLVWAQIEKKGVDGFRGWYAHVLKVRMADTWMEIGFMELQGEILFAQLQLWLSSHGRLDYMRGFCCRQSCWSVCCLVYVQVHCSIMVIDSSGIPLRGDGFPAVVTRSSLPLVALVEWLSLVQLKPRTPLKLQIN